MEYVANPVIVTAHKIIQIKHDLGKLPYLILDNLVSKIPTKEMLARIKVRVGDYWVIQSDGYEYLNPKEVFERKYSPKDGGK